MKLPSIILLVLALFLFFGGCKKANEPKLIFKFKFDPTQQRLNNFGRDTALPAGHGGQDPTFNKMSAHYIELAPGALTPLGAGAIVYKAPQTTLGGADAIDFSKSSFAGNNEIFYELPLKSIASGDYEYLRVSLAYQNFDIKLYIDTTVNVPVYGNVSIQQEFPCTVASFIGFNTYIKNYTVKTDSITVNANKAQGYWGFEATGNVSGYPFHYLTSGQAPPGATTVVNPLFSTSPVPAGSCVVTGPFSGGKLTITGKETSDIVISVSLSTNKSFEWVEVVPDGKWEPSKGENIVDMGIRGMIPTVTH